MQGTNDAQEELGLVMYNANSDLGLDVQYIPWTKDVNYFLGILSSLAFNGDNVNQHTLVEGLAEALTMFPRPSNTMTPQEYYEGERHCIIVTARDPVPRKMLVTVPEIQGRFVGTQLHTLNADFYTLVEMFGPLAISLSLISPKQHSTFGVIFNLGNNDSPLANTSISTCRTDQFTILLSRNFKEARVALREKKIVDSSVKERVESMRRLNDIRLPIGFDNDLQGNMVTEEQIIEAAKDDRLKSANVPNFSTSEVGISIPPMIASTTTTCIVGERTSKGLVQEKQGNKGVIGNNSRSTTIGVSIINLKDAPLYDKSMFPHSTRNTFTVQPYPSPLMLPSASSIIRHNNSIYPQVPFQLNGFGPLGRPSLGTNMGSPLAPLAPQFNPSDFWPLPESCTIFQDCTQVWEGSLEGKIYKNRLSLHLVKAYRKARYPSMICRGPIDYVFFHLNHFNNLDLFEHLENKNLNGLQSDTKLLEKPFTIYIKATTHFAYQPHLISSLNSKIPNMEFHILPIATIFMLVVATNAALPPEFYWKSMLPTTPMPKAITDLLYPDWREEKDTSVDVGKGGVNVGVVKGNPVQGSGTDVNVGGGDGGVNVITGPKGKPVHVGVGPHSPFDYSYAASETQLHDDPNVALFFLEKNLHHGTKLNLHFTHTSNVEATFLPRSLADSVPFSSNKVSDILEKFSFREGSDEAQVVKNTLNECEGPSLRGEEKLCVTSLESMVDFASSKLGNDNVDAVSTEVRKESGLQQYTMAPGVKKLGQNKAVVCHKENYPYAVFYCHKSDTTRVYSVPLEGADGSRVKAVAVCHTDTSKWNPKHLAFQVLKVQPGTVPVCHFLPQDHVVFVPK
ncbi:hypothetical protein VNO78_30602 [Psophocarpus tetragonolobus]|uniref:BURP domain-containing protein n=1 Tax=Psophocarpus tetragonolobus TaxID=3891 RepID=A0AAN9X7L2_PSOTE